MTIQDLDAMSQEDLMTFWQRYHRPSRKDAAALVGKRRGYTRICGDLAAYASNRATALSCAARGDAIAESAYTRICDDIYAKLSADLQTHFMPQRAYK